MLLPLLPVIAITGALRARSARKLDVADAPRCPRRARFGGERDVDGQARRQQHAARTPSSQRASSVSSATSAPGTARAARRGPAAPRGCRSRARARRARRVTRDGHSGRSEPDDQTPCRPTFRTACSLRRARTAERPPWSRSTPLLRVPSLRHQRIFKLAKPINTKITVMIQKRTITFGSAQPLSSK